MRRCPIGPLLCLFFLAPAGMADQGGDPETGIDLAGLTAPFTELRLDYAKRADFAGSWVADSEREAVDKAQRSGDTSHFLELSERWLKKCPVDARIHLARASALSQAGESSAAGKHRFMFYGLLASILASGDGRAASSAYKVISVDEEYTVLNYIGGTMKRQHVEGGVDVLQVSLGEKEVTMYFDVKLGLRALERLVGAKP